MAAPLEHVHDEVRARRRAGGRSSLSAGDLADRRPGSCRARGCGSVSRQTPSAGWSAACDEPPGVVVLADVAAPGERLVGDAERRAPRPARPAPRSWAAARASSSIGVGRGVRADEHQCRPRARSITSNFASARRRLRAKLLGRHRLEVAERLVEVDGQAEARRRSLAHLGGRQRRADEVVLEHLDAVEAGARGGVELLLERAAEARRWRSPLRTPPPRPSPTSAAKWRSMRSRSGSRAGEQREGDSAAWKTAMPPPSSVRQPSCRALRAAARSRAGGRRRRRPTGDSRRRSRREGGAVDGPSMPNGVAWMTPSAASQLARPGRRAATATGRRSAAERRPAPRRAPRSASTTASRSTPSDDRRVRDRGPRAAGADEHDALGRRRRAARARSSPANPGQSVLCPTAAAVVEHDRVDRAERLGLGRERVEVLDHELLAGVGDVEAAEAERAGRRARARRRPRAATPSSPRSMRR